jgi:NAD(P)-dependent dehydrogenase (short-subunit alcohol dehydrogenase family)
MPVSKARKRVCAVVGVGPGNGAALARHFAAKGYAVALLARSAELTGALAKELPDSRAFACDVSTETSVAKAFASVREELGEVDTLVYNAGSGTWGTIEDATPADFETAWRVNTLGAFLVSTRPTPFSSSRTIWRTRSFR